MGGPKKSVSRACTHLSRWRLAIPPLATCVLLCPAPASAQSLDQLQGMSIEDLGEVNVSSVSKTDQPLADAPAAIRLKAFHKVA